LPANNVQEFVTLAKKSPGKLNYASVGSGSSNRLHSENLHRLAGIDVVHVPYKGGEPSSRSRRRRASSMPGSSSPWR
jgi:tripartite-type tricarboxylate transporter receptor subunit TctC